MTPCGLQKQSSSTNIQRQKLSVAVFESLTGQVFFNSCSDNVMPEDISAQKHLCKRVPLNISTITKKKVFQNVGSLSQKTTPRSWDFPEEGTAKARSMRHACI